jgi:drug/metabolite transporter (DMT)-like permease
MRYNGGIMSRTNVRGSLILFITALIWGAAFVAQKIGTVELDAFTFVSARFFISGIALLPVALFRGRHSNTGGIGDGETKPRAKTLFAGGIACGVCLAFASVAQQTGMEETTAGKAGFITALYILFVPVFRFFGGKKVTAAVWLSVLAALAGFYLLCVKEGFSVGAGDAFVLLSALLFTAHILVIDRFSPCADGIQMSCIQFFVASAVSAIPMLLFEKRIFIRS